MIIAFPSPDPSDLAIGTRLKKWRETHKASLNALAGALGLSAANISRAERRRKHLNSRQLYGATFFSADPFSMDPNVAPPSKIMLLNECPFANGAFKSGSAIAHKISEANLNYAVLPNLLTERSASPKTDRKVM
jgi:transcriptional regulator with XRE-family HTH domain